MKKLMLIIVKLLISVVFQYSIFMGTFVFIWIANELNTIVFWLIFILAFVLGETGIFLFCTVKPLEEKLHRVIYSTIYIGIHIASITAFCYVYAYALGIFDGIVDTII